MRDRYKKEIWRKDLKKTQAVILGKSKTALKDTNSGRVFLEDWENRANTLKTEGM